MPIKEAVVHASRATQAAPAAAEPVAPVLPRAPGTPENLPVVPGAGSAGLPHERGGLPDPRLPLAGAAFSSCVLLLGVWDHAAYAAQDHASALLRLALVLLGMAAYAWPGLGWTALPRWMLLYTTHALAMVANAVSLSHGLMQAMPVLLVTLLATGLIETRRRQCLALVLPPALLHLGAGALALARPAWLASIAAWALAIALALLIAAAQGALRRAQRWREEQLLEACRFDSLSGAMSRAYLSERAARDFSLARRHGRPLAVAMLDIDHFKRVNDTHGHATGDAVIRALVASCKTSLRHEDYVGRIGGEEFVCVMPETGASEALACAERIRANFARVRVAGPTGEVCATVSIGVAVIGEQDGWDALLREADTAMYRAKNTGRNRSVLAARPDRGTDTYHK